MTTAKTRCRDQNNISRRRGNKGAVTPAFRSGAARLSCSSPAARATLLSEPDGRCALSTTCVVTCPRGVFSCCLEDGGLRGIVMVHISSDLLQIFFGERLRSHLPKSL